MNDEQRFPSGWDESMVREVRDHYETQSEDEQAAEIEDAHEAEGTTLVAVPTELVPEVQALIDRSKRGE
jgi:hypothetical protein